MLPLTPMHSVPFRERPSFNNATFDDRLKFLGMLWDEVRDTPADTINQTARSESKSAWQVDMLGIWLSSSDIKRELRIWHSGEWGLMDSNLMRALPMRFVFWEGGLSNFLLGESCNVVRMEFGGSMKSELLARIMVVAWLLERDQNSTAHTYATSEWYGPASFTDHMLRSKFQKFARPYIEAATDYA